MKIIFALLIIASLFLEATVTTIPLVFFLLLFLTLLYRSYWIFPIGFLSGILLDSVLFRTLGITSLFFVAFSFIVLMYQRKFEISTLPFVFAASFLGSFVYLLLFSSGNLIIFQAVLCALVAILIFKFIHKLDIVTS